MTHNEITTRSLIVFTITKIIMKKILLLIVLLAIVFFIIDKVQEDEEVVIVTEEFSQSEIVQANDDYRDSLTEVKTSIDTGDKDMITVSLSKLAKALEKLELIENSTTDTEIKAELNKRRNGGNSIKVAIEDILENTEGEIVIEDSIIESIDEAVDETTKSIEEDVVNNPEILDTVNLENNIDIEDIIEEEVITDEENILDVDVTSESEVEVQN